MTVRLASPSTTRLRAHLRDVTAKAILEAAEAMFAERGYAATSMHDIATRSGVAVGTLYNHFKDKGALVTTLLSTRREELLAGIDDALAKAKKGSAREQGLALVTAVLEHCDRHRPFMRMYLQTGDAAVEAAKKKKHEDVQSELKRRATAIVAAGVKKGELDKERAAVLPAILLGAMRGVLLDAVHGEAPREVTSLAPAIIDTFFDGAAPRRASSRAAEAHKSQSRRG